ncbi:TIM barrel protein [Mycolicibacterium smegmatis]|uniref:hydroxypyruvate isomerase family protein n=1 Tax=Mycolicibacterium smegmatis TaxID=1772 RepID=UPI001E4D2C1A|nr:TIM barrel protein [Mycolicibacterium smegmatis]UGU31258.1 TIM barrel protein [Mycolicibacterium smegmatis]ULN72156.1 TIM barrel protein [Mycolicibacterium smegmatis]
MGAVSSRYVVNCSILLTDLPLLQRPCAARAAGFEAVEFWWPFPDPVPGDREVDAFVRAVTDAGVRLTALNFEGGDLAAGERGIVSHPDRQSAFRDNVDVAMGIADRLGTKAFNALYGNRLPGVAAQHQDDVAVENLAYAARKAQQIGAVILVEPLSGVASHPIRTAADAIGVIDRVREQTGAGALRLLADLYHLAVNGEDLAAVIDEHNDRIGHVQIADAPGRGAPGTGTLDFPALLTRLGERGYRGHVSLEYRADQSVAGSDPFAWLPPSQRLDPWA